MGNDQKQLVTKSPTALLRNECHGALRSLDDTRGNRGTFAPCRVPVENNSQGCSDLKTPKCTKYATFWGDFFNFLWAKKKKKKKKKFSAPPKKLKKKKKKKKKKKS